MILRNPLPQQMSKPGGYTQNPTGGILSETAMFHHLKRLLPVVVRSDSFLLADYTFPNGTALFFTKYDSRCIVRYWGRSRRTVGRCHDAGVDARQRLSRTIMENVAHFFLRQSI